MRKIKLATVLTRPRKALPQLLETAGFVAVTAGCWEIREFVGLIVGGALAAAAAYTLETK